MSNAKQKDRDKLSSRPLGDGGQELKRTTVVDKERESDSSEDERIPRNTGDAGLERGLHMILIIPLLLHHAILHQAQQWLSKFFEKNLEPENLEPELLLS